jgi:hypothetical protein
MWLCKAERVLQLLDTEAVGGSSPAPAGSLDAKIMRLRRLANIARRSGRSTYARVTPDISDLQCGQRVALIGMAAKSIEASSSFTNSVWERGETPSGVAKDKATVAAVSPLRDRRVFGLAFFGAACGFARLSVCCNYRTPRL